MKILVLSDGLGWVIDRIAYLKQSLITKYEIDVDFYTQISPSEFMQKAKQYDLIVYENWDMRLWNELKALNIPWIYHIRSHRFPPITHDIAKTATKVVTITPALQQIFPESIYIPDPLFLNYPLKKQFTIGMAMADNEPNKEYKGLYLVKEICEELDITLKVAHNIPPEQMPEWYKSLDLYVCASINEGASTPVMECLSMNIPVITTNVGVPSTLNIHKVERNHESIKNMIQRFYTAPQLEHLLPHKIVDRWLTLYDSILNV